jgi:ribosomal protein L11 methyltransferase
MALRALWQSRFLVPAGTVELFLDADALEGEALSVSAFEETGANGQDGLWRIELIQSGQPDRLALAGRLAPLAERAGLPKLDLSVEPIPINDWLSRASAQVPPQRIGRFWIHGSHIREAPPQGAIPIRLDAGLAFGSGEHASTQGCLLALENLARRHRWRRVLDLGCGSGILAIAAAKLRPARVLAADNDPVAVAVARENAERNGVGHRIGWLESEGYKNPLLRAKAPFDVILANILADPLCKLAHGTARHLAPGGAAVLSGLLERQAERVIDAHRRAGLRLRREITLGIWTTLVLARPGRR